MHESLKRLLSVKEKVKEIITKKQLNNHPKIIVVSKTFAMNKIMPLIESGHIDFGENKIQEAEDKWIDYRNIHRNVKLHMIGKLQSNKARRAVKLFDYIHSLDSEKLALKIQESEIEINKKTKLFIQVNIAEEKQKSGILLNDISNFYSFCKRDLSLDIIGLMCLPPLNDNPSKFFKILKSIAIDLDLKFLSMGMSSDYEDAILNGSNYLRLGTAILGKRTIT
jgi:PLP dependent protein